MTLDKTVPYLPYLMQFLQVTSNNYNVAMKIETWEKFFAFSIRD